LGLSSGARTRPVENKLAQTHGYFASIAQKHEYIAGSFFPGNVL